MIERQIEADLKSDEGFRPTAYQDHLGYWTVGYGFLVDSRRGGGIPEEIADIWLSYQIDLIMDELDERLPWLGEAPDGVVRAMANMAFQLGINGLMKFRKTLGYLEAGDYSRAAQEALNSKWARQTPNRAKRVAQWIRNEHDKSHIQN